jgi:hypothetical protein
MLVILGAWFRYARHADHGRRMASCAEHEPIHENLHIVM